MVYGWGRNENGQLGVGNTMNAPIPLNLTNLNKMNIVDLACGWQHCLALSSEGRLFSWVSFLLLIPIEYYRDVEMKVN